MTKNIINIQQLREERQQHEATQTHLARSSEHFDAMFQIHRESVQSFRNFAIQSKLPGLEFFAKVFDQVLNSKWLKDTEHYAHRATVARMCIDGGGRIDGELVVAACERLAYVNHMSSDEHPPMSLEIFALYTELAYFARFGKSAVTDWPIVLTDPMQHGAQQAQLDALTKYIMLHPYIGTPKDGSDGNLTTLAYVAMQYLISNGYTATVANYEVNRSDAVPEFGKLILGFEAIERQVYPHRFIMVFDLEAAYSMGAMRLLQQESWVKEDEDKPADESYGASWER